MLQRLEIREIPLICEWDSDEGRVMLGLGGEREEAWAMMTALHEALLRETGAEWVDEGMRERMFTRASCMGMKSAVVWEATFTPPASVEMVPRVIAAAAGR